MKPLSSKEYIAVAVGLAVVVMVFLGGRLPFSAPTSGDAPADGTEAIAMDASSPAASGQQVSITNVTLGTGAEAKVGSSVEVHYNLTLQDGTKVDSSYDRGAPLPFTIGSGQVIPGFDLGVLGMKVGGKRTVLIPPALGYGSGQVGPIPPNSTLNFEIELVSVK